MPQFVCYRRFKWYFLYRRFHVIEFSFEFQYIGVEISFFYVYNFNLLEWKFLSSMSTNESHTKMIQRNHHTIQHYPKSHSPEQTLFSSRVWRLERNSNPSALIAMPSLAAVDCSSSMSMSDPIPMASIFTPSLLSFRASSIVSFLLFDLPSVTSMAILGTSFLPP